MKYARSVFMVVIAVGIITSILLGSVLYLQTKEMEQYEKNISNALLLSADLLNEVRQLSTHARTAVITGKQDEELAYKHILEVREARPERHACRRRGIAPSFQRIRTADSARNHGHEHGKGAIRRCLRELHRIRSF